MPRVSLIFFLVFLFQGALLAQTKTVVEPNIVLFDSSKYLLDGPIQLRKLSLRGLSVYSDKYLAVSGTQGVLGLMEDGITWKLKQLPAYPKSDFRDIEVLRPGRLVMMSSGFPALVLTSNNGGKTWNESLRFSDSAVFLDGMDFWNAFDGVLLGDPIHGKFLIYRTKDGGKTWTEMPEELRPDALPGEACFAASGTAIRCLPNGDFAFVSGGSDSRFFYFSKRRNSWLIEPISIVKGKASQGCFSFAPVPKDPLNENLFCFVGGDYLQDTATELVSSAWYRLNPPLWFRGKFVSHPSGYRSAVECLKNMELICAGPSGVDFCQNQGVEKNWFSVSSIGFHAVRQAKRGTAVYFSGGAGRIAKLEFKKKQVETRGVR